MKETTIEKLAYTIKKTKEKPIIFLGAGASASGNIPLASDIEEYILKEYSDNPYIKDTDDKSYSGLMECLSADQRNTLLKNYIDKANINITHIYLAQLMKNNFIDYILTVNFDNLMLRALSLYNIYPPTYDMAILNDLTTSTFHKKSVVYLHGQHHGLWLLNTPEEMNKVNDVIPSILNTIKDRPWIFVGYSASDPIFEHIKTLGRFDKGLFWICYKNYDAPKNVEEELLDKPNTNSFYIKGYDSDSFMLKLNHELGLVQPDILRKPFTFLENSLENIVDIEDADDYKDIKQRLEIIKKQVNQSIQEYEEGKEIDKNQEEINLDILKQKIIDAILNEDFKSNKIQKIEKEVLKINNISINKLFASIYINWSNSLYLEEKYKESIEKIKKALKFNPSEYKIFYNWGTALSKLGDLDKNSTGIYNESIEKFTSSLKLKKNHVSSFINRGNTLIKLSKEKDSDLLTQAINDFKSAIKINPKSHEAYNNWASVERILEKNNDKKSLINIEELYKKSIKYGGAKYNLACLYSIQNKKEEAFEILNEILKNNEITKSHILEDEDWKHYLEDEEFLNIINKYD